MQEQLHTLLKKLVLKNNIHLHQEELKLQLLSHPSYPSLHSLTGVLTHFGIPNLALRLQVNQEILTQLPFFFIANVDLSNGGELVLVEKKKNHIEITTNSNKKERLTDEGFLSKWNGVILAIEKDASVKETASNSKYSFLKWATYSLGALLIAYFLYNVPDYFSKVHFALSLIGIILSVFIVKHELGLQSEATNSFCNLSENTSCDALLNSDGAKVFGLFKLSDVSIVIFSGYALSWILFSLNGTLDIAIFYCFTALAVPFIIYSVYYQAAVVKKWCPLCLGIVGVLLLQFGAMSLTDSWATFYSLTLNSIGLFTFGMFLTTIVWSYLKPILKKKFNLETIEVEYYRFKRNYEIFNTMLLNGQQLTSNYEIPGEIVLGNKNAPIEMIVVTSPFCHYCKPAHSDIDKLLLAGKENLKVTIRFNIGAENKESDFYKIVSQLLNLYNSQGQEACLVALQEIYAEKVNLKEWVANINIHNNPDYDQVMESQKSWCELNDINFTPAFYLNGVAYPKEYDRTDLIYFLDEMIEEQQTQFEPLVPA